MTRLILFTIFLALSQNYSLAQTYLRDSTFGVHGIARIVSTDITNGLSFNGWGKGFFFSDNRILAIHNPTYTLPIYGFVADHGLIAFTEDGKKIDSSFGENGIKNRPFTPLSSISSNANFPWCTAKLADGRLLVAGQRKLETLPFSYLNSVVCYKSNGFIDSSFGNQGVVFHNSFPGATSGSYSRVISIIPQSETRIILHCQVNSGENNRLVAITKFGTIDSSYGINGVQDFSSLDLPDELQFYAKSALNPNGEIFVAAVNYDSMSWIHKSEYLVKVDYNGNIDNSFGVSGKRILDSSILARSNISDALVNRMSIGENKKVYILMHAKNSENHTLLRCLQDGSIDSSFGVQGLVEFQFSPTSVFNQFLVSSFLVLQNNKIVLTGIAKDSNAASTSSDIMVMFLNENGKIDSSFGTNGITFIDGGVNAYDGGTLIISSDSNSFIVCGSDQLKYYLMIKFKSSNQPNSVLDQAQKQELVLYPIPFKDRITIKNATPVKHASLSSLDGKRIFEKLLVDKNNQISIEHVPNGIYILTTTLENGSVYTSKIQRLN